MLMPVTTAPAGNGFVGGVNAVGLDGPAGTGFHLLNLAESGDLG